MRDAFGDGYSPMLGVCASPGCSTLVFGQGTCLEHTAPQTKVFVVGRPFLRARGEALAEDRVVEMAGGAGKTS